MSGTLCPAAKGGLTFTKRAQGSTLLHLAADRCRPRLVAPKIWLVLQPIRFSFGPRVLHATAVSLDEHNPNPFPRIRNPNRWKDRTSSLWSPGNPLGQYYARAESGRPPSWDPDATNSFVLKPELGRGSPDLVSIAIPTPQAPPTLPLATEGPGPGPSGPRWNHPQDSPPLPAAQVAGVLSARAAQQQQ